MVPSYIPNLGEIWCKVHILRPLEKAGWKHPQLCHLSHFVSQLPRHKYFTSIIFLKNAEKIISLLRTGGGEFPNPLLRDLQRETYQSFKVPQKCSFPLTKWLMDCASSVAPAWHKISIDVNITLEQESLGVGGKHLEVWRFSGWKAPIRFI